MKPHLANAPERDAFSAGRRPGQAIPMAVLSIAFPREDFERISTCAGQIQERISEFVRGAAIERVQRLTAGATLASSSGTGWLVMSHLPPPDTRVSGATASEDLSQILTGALTTRS